MLTRAPSAQRAVHRVERTLLRNRDRDGLWRDFRTLAGPSSEWVTAAVATSLAHSEDARAREAAADAAAALLRRQRPNGGWGYNRNVPPDCDTTAWVVLALVTCGVPWRPSSRARALRYLAAHQLPGGGFATYGSYDGIDRFIDAPGQAALRGWTRDHTCVSAMAVRALAALRAPQAAGAVATGAAYLQERGGPSWRAYWWTGTAYATHHAARALAAAAPGSLDPLELAEATARASEAGGPPIDQAWRLGTLLASAPESQPAAVRALVKELLEGMASDGTWEPEPILRIPSPTTRDPDDTAGWRVDELGTHVIVSDERRVFTAAAAVSVLRAAVATGWA